MTREQVTEDPAMLEWLVEKVGTYLDLAPASVDVDRPLAELGLDSVYALTLCGDAEDEFGIEVEATMAWDHPTVRALAAGLAELREASRV